MIDGGRDREGDGATRRVLKLVKPSIAALEQPSVRVKTDGAVSWMVSELEERPTAYRRGQRVAFQRRDRSWQLQSQPVVLTWPGEDIEARTRW